jgi:hypothetical protein
MAKIDKATEAGGGFLGGLQEGFAVVLRGGGDLLKGVIDAVEGLGNSALNAGKLAEGLAVSLVDMVRGEPEVLRGNSAVASNSGPVVDDMVKLGAAQRVEPEKTLDFRKLMEENVALATEINAVKNNPVQLAALDMGETGRAHAETTSFDKGNVSALGAGKATGAAPTATA